MPALLLCCIIVLSVVFKNIKYALLSVLPAICAIGAFFAFAALFAIEINIFALLALPLLIGLSVDYGIFMIFQNADGKKLHPTKALFIAAVSTLIGFGSLIAAHHKVLFIIGFMVFIGILTAMLVSVFIIPPFLKNEREN
jgi:predicted exporter